jgi:hypothetical protein
VRQQKSVSQNCKHYASAHGRFLLSVCLILACSLLAISLVGCSHVATNSAATNTPANSATPSGNVYSIAIISKGEQIASFTRNALLKLEQVYIEAGGSEQSGPTLLSVLQLAGISDFNDITAYGLNRGRLATAELTLQKSQIDENVVLDMTNRGTCKLCGTDISQNDWIIDINKLEVE